MNITQIKLWVAAASIGLIRLGMDRLGLDWAYFRAMLDIVKVVAFRRRAH